MKNILNSKLHFILVVILVLSLIHTFYIQHFGSWNLNLNRIIGWGWEYEAHFVEPYLQISLGIFIIAYFILYHYKRTTNFYISLFKIAIIASFFLLPTKSSFLWFPIGLSWVLFVLNLIFSKKSANTQSVLRELQIKQ